MEFVDIGRMLWRHRVLTLLGAPIVVALALLGTHRVSLSPLSLSPRQATTAFATARILVDTPKSQLVDLKQTVGLDPTITDALQIRVGILADEMAIDGWRASLARNAGIPADKIDVASSNGGASYTTPLARRLADVNVIGNRPYVVRLRADSALPILTLNATAARPAEASRLAEATIATFATLINSEGAHRGLVAHPLGAPRIGLLAPGSGRAMTAALAVFALCAWLVAIVFVGGAAAWLRSRPARDHREERREKDQQQRRNDDIEHAA